MTSLSLLLLTLFPLVDAGEPMALDEAPSARVRADDDDGGVREDHDTATIERLPLRGPDFEVTHESDATSEAAIVEARARREEHPGQTITFVEVAVDRARPGEENELVGYLRTIVGREAVSVTAESAEQMLMKVGRYRAAVCRLWTTEKHRGRLRCGVSRARTIRRVSVEGLPLQLLETDLKKRIFLRPGEILDQKDAAGRDRVTRQRVRIEEYLARLGYYGASVEVLTPPVSKEADVDVTIRISGGGFVRVYDVEVEEAGPIASRELEARFKRLCLNIDGSLEALERLTFACLTRDRLVAARTDVENQARARGHPEARVSVRTEIISPTAADTPGVCRASAAEEAASVGGGPAPAPRCARLFVRVRAGPRVIPRLIVERQRGDPDDLKIVDDRFRARFLPSVLQPIIDLGVGLFHSARTLSIDPMSRALQVLLDQDVEAARDTIVYLSEVESAFTFASTGTADEEEVEETRRALLAALADRGRLLAQVTAEREERDGELIVTFRIRPGPPVAVERVRFFGNQTFSDAEILDAITLSAKPRGVVTPGFVGRADLDDDALRLMRFYEMRGFHEANVVAETYLQSGGNVEVHYFVDEGERFTLAELIVEGGRESLLPDVLAAIAHCRGGAAMVAGRAPRVAQDCVGAPFLPDEFEADRTRVLNVYVAHGFPYTRVEVTPDFVEAGASLRIKIGSVRDEVFVAGPPEAVQLGQIFIDGNEHTERSVMLRELDLDEGLLEPTEVALGVSRLRRTGIYNKIALQYIGIEEREDTVHMRLLVEERPTLTYDTSIAFSTNRFFSIRNEVRERNLLGRMLDLSLLADLGLFVGRYSIIEPELRWPRFLGWPFWLRITPGVIYEDRPGKFVSRVPSERGPLLAIPSWDAADVRRRNLKLMNKVSLEWRPPSLDVIVGLDYELRLEWDDPQSKPLDVFSGEAFTHLDGLLDVVQVRPIRVSTLMPRMTWRSLDNPFDPTRGFTVDLSVRAGAPFIGNEEWLAVPQFGVTGYYSFGRITLAGRFRGWTAYSYGEPGRRSIALQQDLVAIGGDRSVRGYMQDRIGVVDLPARAARGEDVTDDGHLAIFGAVTNLEVRYTLVRGFFLGDLKGAAFIDAGLVTNNDRTLLDDERALDILIDSRAPRLGVGIGVGVRYVLPVGPLALDVACPPLPRPSGELCTFHAQLGYAF
jgi:outer membrane protein assembly factor BamA